jgi:hypothetical protein
MFATHTGSGANGYPLRCDMTVDREDAGAPHESFAAARALVGSARAFLGRGEYGPAIVVAQAAAEVALAGGVAVALDRRNVGAALAAWIARRDVHGQSFSADSDRVQALWAALTDDRLTAAPWWPRYAEGVRARDRFVHEGTQVGSSRQPESFIDAVESLVEHVATVSR